MLILTESLAEEYMKNNAGVSIYVEGGGTVTGIKALAGGEVDICTASRLLKPEEAKLLSDYYGTLGIYFLIAKDLLSIYLNPDNPVKNLSLEQLKGIYTGSIKNWKDVGGADQIILPIIRSPNSGTRLYFKEHVLADQEYCDWAVIKPTTEEIVEEVFRNENAIGYGGVGYGSRVYHASIEGIEPVEENARNDRYPLTRYLHFFTSKTPSGAVKKFIDWVLSPEGQKVVERCGYVSLWDVSH